MKSAKIMFSKKCTYAIKAVMTLARAEEDGVKERFRIRDLAKKAELPGPYLAKIVGELARAGVLRTERGLRGGVRLARPASLISLSDVVEAMDRIDGYRQCVLEARPCNEVAFCPLHKTCKAIRERILKRSNFDDLSHAYKVCTSPARKGRKKT